MMLVATNTIHHEDSEFKQILEVPTLVDSKPPSFLC